MRPIQTLPLSNRPASGIRRLRQVAAALGLGFIVGLALTAIIGLSVQGVSAMVRAAAQRRSAEDDIRKAAETLETSPTPHIAAFDASLPVSRAVASTSADDEGFSPFDIDPNLSKVDGAVGANQTLGSALASAGLDSQKSLEILNALQGVLDFRRIRPGERFTVALNRQTGVVERVVYRKDRTLTLHLQRTAEGLSLHEEERETKTVVVPLSGEISSSLAMSLDGMGEGAALTEMVADVFAWDINFYTDSRKGDRFRIIVEKVLVGDQFLRYGSIIAAEYFGSFTGDRYAYRYDLPARGGEPAKTDYFDAKGNSLRRSFMKAPLSTVRITSMFGFRRHPILGKGRPHLGVDFGAPKGTPVFAVADGVVLQAGVAGGYGKMILLQHAMGYRTRYGHLSSIKVRAGQRVGQKQVIGNVGSTGLSTGPHLHYELHLSGKPINPLKVKFEQGKPVPADHKDRFLAQAAEYKTRLDLIPWPERYGPLTAEAAALAGVGAAASVESIATPAPADSAPAEEDENDGAQSPFEPTGGAMESSVKP